jgi:protease I
MSNELSGKRVAFLVANQGVEQVELTGPWQAVKDAGGQPVLLAPEKEQVPSLRTDITNAGGHWRDVEVFSCPANGFTLVTSPKPDDLDAFTKATIEAVATA